MIDTEKTLELIERMKLAKIGKYKKWDQIVKKINSSKELNPGDLAYFSNFTRIYKDSKVTSKSKIFHTKLSEHDKKPPCHTCGQESLFYCNMNDAYFCPVHVIGHDENEI